MKVNVKGGTRSDTQTLCPSCKFGTVVRGAADSQEIIRCGHYTIDRAVPFPVVECTGYEDKAAVNLYEMQQIAWVVDSNRRRVGFVRPEKWREQNPNRNPLDGFDTME